MRRRWFIALLPLVASGCGGAGPAASTGSTAPNTAPANTAAPAMATSIFDPAVLHDVRITMSAADWDDLRQYFRDNQYYAANVTIDGETVPQVGVRSRGEGSRSGTKPALKLDFNQYVKGQRFRGQKSLAVKNLIQDASLLRDYLAMLVFEAMGIAAPKYSFARLTVNGEPMGLFNIVESVEEPFLSSRFGENDGNLFNYEYGIGADIISWDFSSRGNRPERYIPRPLKPETNEDTLDGDALVDFVFAANFEPDATFLPTISRFIDVDRFLTYLATENALAEHDGFLGDAGMNNFFLYQYVNTARFVLIPWDKNTGFTNAHWPILYNLETNVLARRITADPAKLKVYRDAVSRAATSYVNGRFLVPKLDQAYALIHAAALADNKKPYDNATFEAAVSGLRGLVAAREADVVAQTR